MSNISSCQKEQNFRGQVNYLLKHLAYAELGFHIKHKTISRGMDSKLQNIGIVLESRI